MKRTAAGIIKQHYGLTRKVTPGEVADEIKSLIRKHAKGSLDFKDESLYYRLNVAGFVPENKNPRRRKISGARAAQHAVYNNPRDYGDPASSKGKYIVQIKRFDKNKWTQWNSGNDAEESKRNAHAISKVLGKGFTVRVIKR